MDKESVAFLFLKLTVEHDHDFLCQSSLMGSKTAPTKKTVLKSHISIQTQILINFNKF